MLNHTAADQMPEWLPPLLRHSFVTPQQYAAIAPSAHRRQWGQYFTPPRIAAWMAGWAIQPQTRSVFDPAVGMGALLDAVLAHPRLHPDLRLTGIDADPAILQICAANVQQAAARIDLYDSDFLTESNATTYDAILCNPPYIRHRHLQNRRALYAAFGARYDLTLSAFSNSYVLFILKIASLLSAHGRAAILAPCDYLNANFGAPIRAFLLRENVLDGVLLFDAKTLIFDDANVAATILLLRADRAPSDPINFVHVTDETDLAPLHELPPHAIRYYQPAQLRPDAKWLPLLARTATIPVLLPRRRTIPLGELADVKRGIATGANEFFTLSESERTAQMIPATDLRPCTTKAPHAPGLRFTADDWAALREAGAKIYVLNPQTQLNAATQRYLDHGLKLGIHRRYLPASRNPWYSAEPRPIAPLWVTTFSRRGFRFVLNDAGVAHLTAFHGIYPYDSARDDLVVLAAFLNSAVATPLIMQHARFYGSGLAKFEPLDVATIPVPDPHRLSTEIKAAIVALYERRCTIERTDSVQAAQIAAELDQMWTTYLADDRRPI